MNNWGKNIFGNVNRTEFQPKMGQILNLYLVSVQYVTYSLSKKKQKTKLMS